MARVKRYRPRKMNKLFTVKQTAYLLLLAFNLIFYYYFALIRYKFSQHDSDYFLPFVIVLTVILGKALHQNNEQLLKLKPMDNRIIKYRRVLALMLVLNVIIPMFLHIFFNLQNIVYSVTLNTFVYCLYIYRWEVRSLLRVALGLQKPVSPE